LKFNGREGERNEREKKKIKKREEGCCRKGVRESGGRRET